jgi:class 3 adenylate cyclase/predicted ATPase
VRKTVTIVFCDLVGSTALGERTDPELYRELMGRYHTELRSILERHGGTVEKFIGDAAMAIFGIPQVHEDDALRAVRAAVDMRAGVVPLGLEVRIGVNTGEVVAGAGETLALGDAVNVAARLEQHAGAGEILLGAATQRLVRDAVRLEAVDPLSLKGKREGVPAWRVIEVISGAQAAPRRARAPFVGRAQELSALQAALAAAQASRTAQLATIVGAPGIGKSRLASELLRGSGARVLVGRCLSYGEGITYWPLAEIVSQLGDLSPALAAGDADPALVEARISAALGVAEVAAAPEEIAWGFRKLFESLARRQPLIVVIDDIHWAEPPLLDLLESVAAFAADVPLLLLCTARPELFELRPSWGAPRANSVVVTLEPLGGGDVERMIGELGELDEPTRTRVIEAAEGNPLFVEQLVAYQTESGSDGVEIPGSLKALLHARIDRLAEEERAVVLRGSVEGRLFHRSAVAELLPEDDRAGVGGSLLGLVRKELIRPDSALVPGDDGFRFGHILIRDAAYETLPKRQRADLHERYANWLTARLGDQVPAEIVGYHLEQAHRYRDELGLADRELARRAAEALSDAARAARSRQDVSAVVGFLSRAAVLAGEHDRTARLLLDLGVALEDAGRLIEADERLSEALAQAREEGDERVAWLARLELAMVRVHREPDGATDDALREAGAAIAVMTPLEDHEVLGQAWRLTGLAHLMRADAEAQSAAFERARHHAQAAGDRRLEIEMVKASLPPILFGAVPVDEGLKLVDEIAERLGDTPIAAGFARHVEGHMNARLGRFEGALEAIREWRATFRELGQEGEYGATCCCTWDICYWAGWWEDGERALREGYEILERSGEKATRSTLAAQLAEALVRQGRVEEAEQFIEASRQLGVRDDLFNEVSWRSVKALALSRKGEVEAAEATAAEAAELAGTTGYLELEAQAWLTLAEVRQAGGIGSAAGAAQRARTLYERKGNRVGVARADALLGADTVGQA